MKTIYELTNEVIDLDMQLDQMYQDNEGEITEETEQLEAMRAEIEDKICQAPDNFAAWYKNTDAEIKAKKDAKGEMVKKYDSKIKALENKKEWIKSEILNAMKAKELLKLKGEEFSVSVKTSDRLEVEEEVALANYLSKIDEFNSTLPDWLKVSPKIDKTALKGVEDVDLPEGFVRISGESILVR